MKLNSQSANYGRKAQSTLFMVLGVLIVAGSALYLYSAKEATDITLDRGVLQIQKIPADFEPIRQYVEACIYYTSINGLKVIGERGGYYDLRGIASGNEITAGNKIAKWFYVDEERGTAVLQIPPLKKTPGQQYSVEGELEKYVSSEIDSCINDFADFRKQGFNFEIGRELEPAAAIGEDVRISAKYPIRIEKGQSKVDIEEFSVSVPLNLKKIHEIASAIAQGQAEHRFLEKYTRTLITVYSSPDYEGIPEMSNLRFEFRPLIYSREAVKETMIQILQSGIPRLQVLNSGNSIDYASEDQIGAELVDRLRTGMGARLETLPIIAPVEAHEVEFKFRNDPDPVRGFRFEMCRGNTAVCSSESIGGPDPINSFVPLQRDEFPYDIRYNAKVEIRDPSAIVFGDERYTFSIFLESNILDNLPNLYGDGSAASEIPPGETPPDNAEGQDAGSGVSSFEGPTICNPELWDSRDITITVVNSSHPKKPIDEAEIYYTAAGESCSMGLTGSDGILVTKFPTGVAGGAITAKKTLDFIDRTISFDADTDTRNELRIELEPIVEKRFTVSKKLFEKVFLDRETWMPTDGILRLGSDESAIITLTREQEYGESPFSAFGEFSGSQYGEPPSMRLAHGTYRLNINLLLDKIVVIPEDEKSVPSLNPFKGFREKITIPEIRFGAPAIDWLHVKKITVPGPGAYKYNIKCIEEIHSDEAQAPEEAFRDAGTIEFTVSPDTSSSLVITPRTVSSFGTRKGYVAVETNMPTICELNMPGNQNFGQFPTGEQLTTLHLFFYPTTGEPNTYAYPIRCARNPEAPPAERQWQEWYGLQFTTSEYPQATTFSAVSKTPSAFSGNEVFIALETNKNSYCIYADWADKDDLGQYNYIVEDVNANFPEGGLELEGVTFTNSELYEKEGIEFTAIDLGIDDSDIEDRKLDDLRQFDKIAEYSENDRAVYLPRIR
ncbi:hypothetical protein HYX09_02785 [Candidatus Woesearchaeota archaeon]|nr:hypothetical protein [Candidatus Woesearchaeota archaeon]